MASSSSSSPEIAAAPSATESQSTVQYSHLSREEVLEELSSRFILNLPEEELASLERVCFQVEQAHWYYEDFIREQNPSKFPSYTLKTFSEALFRACPLLHHWAHDHERAFETFMKYKTRVPVCGAIMLNDTWEKCVLVKGWKSSAGWGFPKGKINEQEPRPNCAAREVLEETGYDLEGQINSEDVIELSIKEQSISLYIVSGIPEDFPFKTRTRKEISKIAWFRLSDLPTWKRSKAVPGKFYLISPFIGPLKAFINSRKPRNLPRRARRSQGAQPSQDRHISSEDDCGNHGQGDPITLDVNAQESSSQSSSADNGEPQTPSPQYSVHPVTYQTQDAAVVAVNPATMVDTDGVDPHFARLLTSLTLSASASPMNGDSKPQPPSHKAQRPTSPPFNTSKSPSHSVSTLSSSRAIGSASHLPSRTSTTTPLNAFTQSQTNPFLPSSSGRPSDISDGHLVPSSPAVSSSLATSAASPRHSPRLSRARHGSRISADISPYMSRPRDIPKEMKYISMLENVAKESDKISSQLSYQPSPPSAPSHYTGMSYRVPGPSASVPPGPIYSRMESPVIYSSAPVAASMYSTAAVPLSTMRAFEFQSSEDPFTVRPRTSVPFHQTSYPPRKPSLNEESLRYMLPNMDHRIHPPHLPSPPFHHSGQMGASAHAHTSHYPPLMPPAFNVQPQMHRPNGASHHSNAYPAQPPPPSLSPVINLSQPAQPVNKAHLLSILNTPGSAAHAFPMQPGLMNGTGTR
ncbi:uncharacterized protein FIBRA_01556 [Fibroporia radiculosa]|uniref:Nudix hydrolase domain-containing protein n=1 Tax=Fibroporia radiculosa TaxID=599839 RepID=J4G120_9APHY|nr:uncharacterized protein FIBRA_01556 [Fibroporia radiculosa]CCL99538.1 predicted protein [Fibroporia radiculosa]